MKSLRSLLLLSLTLAGAAVVVPYQNLVPHFRMALAVSFTFSALWGAVFIYGMATLGRRRWWLLFGLPLSLLWPVVDLFLWWACRFGGDCI